MCSLILIKVFMKCGAVLVLAGIELLFFTVASRFGARFGICAENSVDNTGMF